MAVLGNPPTGPAAPVHLPTGNVIGNPTAERERAEQWLSEGRTLVAHHGSPPFYGGPKAAREAGQLAAAEADTMKLKGALRLLFIHEREMGWIAAGQFEQVDEQGLLDELVTPLTLGLVHAPGAGSQRGKQNPKTGRLEKENKASAVEEAEHLPSGILGELESLVNAYGLRLGEILAGAVLILFGLATLAKGGQTPDLPKAVPVPV